ncbi:MAG TPA: lamin tail domain-containing protein [Thermoanaerobaculaceae bacterium]|nr:lamin tail domain-containing protein [Thermoanaerobaculaceae bacterium]
MNRPTPPVSRAAFVACALLFALVAPAALAASPNIVISQVYGGGGATTGSPAYINDYVELFNRGASAQALTGWSLQYGSAAGNFGSSAGNIYAFVAGTTIQPGHYLLVQLGAAGTLGAAVPSPDFTTTNLSMSAASGKVALANITSGLACGATATPCSLPDSRIVDSVSYGASNNGEGGTTVNNGAALDNTKGGVRKGAGCTDTDNNNLDFDVVAGASLVPRNSSSPSNVCPVTTSPTGVGAASPAALQAGESTLLTVAVTPGANPTSTGITVRCDLTAIGGSASQSLYDDGTNGDATSADNVFSFAVTVPGATSTGAKTLACTIGDAQARSGSATITVNVVTLTKIHDIQGNGVPNWNSPYAGQTVTTSGIVTALLSNAFFIQEPDASVDSDPNSSEGLYVYSTPPAGLARGDLIRVTGMVTDYRPSAEPLQPAVTELGSVSFVGKVSSGNPLPTAVTLTTADTDPAGGFYQLAKYDGMRVSFPSMTVVGPTTGSVDDGTGLSTSNGFFWGVVTGIARPFREVGANVLDPLTDCAVSCVPANVPRFDGNPERFDVGSKQQVGASPIEARVGDVLTGLVGPLIFNTSAGYRAWEFFPDNWGGTPSGGPGPAAVSAAADNEFTVASFNMQHFFASSFNNRKNKALAAIRDYLHMPDILAVAEVDTLATLQALRDLLNADASSPAYEAYLVEGNDISGIDVGFLVTTKVLYGSTPRVTVGAVVQEGKDTLFTNPDHSTELLNDRPPLRLMATVNQANGASFPVTVIAVHQKALTSVDSTSPGSNGWGTVGARNRAKREQQAEFLANIIQTRQSAPNNERVIVLGDFNAFEFNDGFVDVMGASTGNPVSADQVELGSPDLIGPNMTILQAAAADQRYSYSESGSAQNLDQMIVSTGVLAAATVRLEHARIDADFPDSDRNDTNSPRRVSDHDPLVGFLAVPSFSTADLSVALSGAPASAPPGSNISYTVMVTNIAGSDTATGVQMTDALPAGTTFVSLSQPGGWDCSTPSVGSNGTITCSIASLGVTSATFTVTIQIVPGTALGTELYHDVSVSATSTDKVTGNNEDGATTIAAAGPAAAITATGGTPQSALQGMPFSSPLQATVTDSLGNPVSGVTVTFTAPASGASGTFPGGLPVVTAVTDAGGVATSPAITANNVLGNFQVTATAPGVSGSAVFLLANLENGAIPALGAGGLAVFAFLLAVGGVLLLRRVRW